MRSRGEQPVLLAAAIEEALAVVEDGAPECAVLAAQAVHQFGHGEWRRGKRCLAGWARQQAADGSWPATAGRFDVVGVTAARVLGLETQLHWARTTSAGAHERG